MNLSKHEKSEILQIIGFPLKEHRDCVIEMMRTKDLAPRPSYEFTQKAREWINELRTRFVQLEKPDRIQYTGTVSKFGMLTMCFEPFCSTLTRPNDVVTHKATLQCDGVTIATLEAKDDISKFKFAWSN